VAAAAALASQLAALQKEHETQARWHTRKVRELLVVKEALRPVGRALVTWRDRCEQRRLERRVLARMRAPKVAAAFGEWRKLASDEAQRKREDVLQRQYEERLACELAQARSAYAAAADELEEEYERRLRERLEQERSEAGEALASSLDAAAREPLSLSLQAEEAAAEAARLAHEHARRVRRLAEQGARHLLQRGLSRALNTWHALAYQRRMMLQSLGFIRNPALGKAFREWRRWSEKAREDADEAARAALAADRLSEQEQQLVAEAARREAEMARRARESEVERLVMRGELEEREIEEMQRHRAEREAAEREQCQMHMEEQMQERLRLAKSESEATLAEMAEVLKRSCDDEVRSLKQQLRERDVELQQLRARTRQGVMEQVMRRTLRRDLHRGFRSWRATWIDRLEQLRLLRRAASGFRSPVKVTVGCSFGSPLTRSSAQREQREAHFRADLQAAHTRREQELACARAAVQRAEIRRPSVHM
jgi:hypothetical protein